jgi:hypothetical protein
MNDRYLWDGSGEADPEIQQLEKSLAGFRYRPRTLHEHSSALSETARRGNRLWIAVAAAAALAIASITGLRIREALTFTDSGRFPGTDRGPARFARGK